MTVYDDDFNAIKKINIKTEKIISNSYSETVTIKPTAAQITDEWTSEETEYDTVWIEQPMNANDLETMIKKLSNAHKGITYHGFTDAEGRISCYEEGVDFYYEQIFDKKYPESYYCIIDGIVNYIYKIRYELVFNDSDLENAEWTIDGDISTSSETAKPMGISFDDYDNNIEGISRRYFTQNIFNEDDKWEYILPQYGPLEKEIGEPNSETDSENGRIYRRFVRETQPRTGYAIYNEDGNILATLNTDRGFDYIFKFNGNIYFVSYYNGGNTLYKYDRKTSSIKEVKQFQGKAFSVGINNRSITVNTGDQKVDEAILYDMQGRKVAVSSNQNSNQLSINTENVPRGIYNVTVKNQDKIERAQKVRIK